MNVFVCSEELLAGCVRREDQAGGEAAGLTAKPLFDSTAPVWTREAEKDVAVTTVNLRRKAIPTTQCGRFNSGNDVPDVGDIIPLHGETHSQREHHADWSRVHERERGEPPPDGAAVDRVLMARIRSDICCIVSSYLVVHVSLASRVTKSRLSWAGPLKIFSDWSAGFSVELIDPTHYQVVELVHTLPCARSGTWDGPCDGSILPVQQGAQCRHAPSFEQSGRCQDCEYCDRHFRLNTSFFQNATDSQTKSVTELRKRVIKK